MDILLTLNRNYLKIANVMLFSLFENNRDEEIRVFILSRDLNISDFSHFSSDRITFSVIRPTLNLDEALTTKRYPEEMYYRLFAFLFLPEDVCKVLYLDPDIIVRKSLKPLFSLDLGSSYCAGCTHVRETLTRINALRLGTEGGTYLNTGVLLLNLDLIRKTFTKEEIERVIIENRNRLLLPDQDVLVMLFKDRIMRLESIIYNLSDRIFILSYLSSMKEVDLDYVEKNTVIIHYCGRNKPWRKGYHGQLGRYYDYYKMKYYGSLN